ncbi:MAG TPA: SUKH-3 domain-containing protein [Pilimelia sp.]|nr:SUKH-3 domain-containing protein [Pilimelia sp.]
MIERGEAEAVAAQWARRESLRRGYECTPMLAEFDLGYVVWTKEPSSVLPMPGDGTVTVIDKETGTLSTWPGIPPVAVAARYRQSRPAIVGGVRTADPAAELRRTARRRPTPAAAARVTLRHIEYVAGGAKGDQRLRHHPLVRDYLDDLPPGHLARGGDRHAELIVLSDTLHAHDADRRAGGAAPVTHEEARKLLGGARLDVRHVREPGDPAGGQPARPCESCVTALVYFGLLPWSDLAYAEQWLPRPKPSPQPGRFPDEVAAVLADGGWAPTDADDALADAEISRVTAVPGQEHVHVVFPAARRALTDFPGLVCGRRGPGRVHRTRVFEINPSAAAYTADVLAEFGTVLGARLFPLGAEGRGDAVLAIDELGRVFALDQAGEWFLGATIDEALTTLVIGGPAPRVRDDGTWITDDTSDTDDTGPATGPGPSAP